MESWKHSERSVAGRKKWLTESKSVERSSKNRIENRPGDLATMRLLVILARATYQDLDPYFLRQGRLLFQPEDCSVDRMGAMGADVQGSSR